MAVHYLGDNGPDGSCLGTGPTEKVGFFGTTPADRPTVTWPTTTTATTTLNETKVNRLMTALTELGIISTTTS